MNRRGFLSGALGFLAAPAIVRASSLMPVSVQPLMIETGPYIICFDQPVLITWGGDMSFSDWAGA